MYIGWNSTRLHHMFTWASNERMSSPFESYEMRIGRQHISQSSTYCCRDTLKSNSIVIGCQQYGQSNSYSISITLVYTSFAIRQIGHEIRPRDACIHKRSNPAIPEGRWSIPGER